MFFVIEYLATQTGGASVNNIVLSFYFSKVNMYSVQCKVGSCDENKYFNEIRWMKLVMSNLMQLQISKAVSFISVRK